VEIPLPDPLKVENGPEIVSSSIVTGTWPTFWATTIATCEGLEVTTKLPPNGEISHDADPEVLVPDSDNVAFPMSVVTVICAVKDPDVDGVNWIEMVQLAPAVKVPVAQEVVAGKSVTSESVMLEICMGALPSFEKVTTAVVFEVLPTCVLGNEKLFSLK
jgi:hypothetical protein